MAASIFVRCASLLVPTEPNADDRTGEKPQNRSVARPTWRRALPPYTSVSYQTGASMVTIMRAERPASPDTGLWST